MWTQRDIENAQSELTNKTLVTIQTETAFVWGARALAAYMLWRSTNVERLLGDALEYRHEAIEHAALAGPSVYMNVVAGLAVLEKFL
jgi:hypothetical protein